MRFELPGRNMVCAQRKRCPHASGFKLPTLSAVERHAQRHHAWPETMLAVLTVDGLVSPSVLRFGRPMCSLCLQLFLATRFVCKHTPVKRPTLVMASGRVHQATSRRPPRRLLMPYSHRPGAMCHFKYKVQKRSVQLAPPNKYNVVSQLNKPSL